MKPAVAALVAVVLLAPALATAPPTDPQVVSVAVGADRATGFVAGDERVVTVAHVLPRDAERVVVFGLDRRPRPATVLRADRRLDLAVLRVSGLGGDAPRLVAGGEARAIVTATGVEPARVVRPIAARVDGSPPRPALELRADVAIGDSGAPVVTRSGAVAGVVFARSRARALTAYAVDAVALGRLLAGSG